MLTSLDILYIVLSVSLVIITVCIVWTFVSVLVVLKRFHDVQKAVVDKVESIGRLVDVLKEKIEHSSSYLAALVELGTRLFEYVKSRKSSAARKKRDGKVIDLE